MIVRRRVAAFWGDMIGKKIVMAVTGIVLVGFVIAHMGGNLKIFAGPNDINAYSRFLREVGWPELGYGQLLWLVRIVRTRGRCAGAERSCSPSSFSTFCT